MVVFKVEFFNVASELPTSFSYLQFRVQLRQPGAQAASLRLQAGVDLLDENSLLSYLLCLLMADLFYYMVSAFHVLTALSTRPKYSTRSRTTAA